MTHWLAELDQIVEAGATTEAIADLVTRESQRAYQAGLAAQPAQENTMTDPSPTDPPTTQPGAYARGILQQQLLDARHELASSEDYLRDLQSSRDSDALRVRELEAAIADLDSASERGRQLEHVITGVDAAASIDRAIRDGEAGR